MSDTDYLSKKAMLENLTADLERNLNESEPLTILIMQRFIKYVDDFPVVDVKPIKHGKWINEEYDTHFDEYHAKCSVCDNESTDSVHITKFHIYCEHCGAIMDGDTP